MMRLVLLLIGFTLSQAISAQNARQLQSIQAFEQTRYQAILENDVDQLQKMLADELVYTHSNCNLETKSEYLAKMREGTYVFTSFETRDTKYRMLGKKAVAATGTAYMSGTYKKTIEFSLESRFSAIYIWRKGHWELHTWQTTQCK